MITVANLTWIFHASTPSVYLEALTPTPYTGCFNASFKPFNQLPFLSTGLALYQI